MKKIIAIVFIVFAGLVACRAENLVFSNQVITVQPNQLSLESIEFSPFDVVTNTVTEWVETTVIETNEQHAGLGDFIVETNTVNRQVSSEVVTTNSAIWTCNVIFSLPKGHQWRLNGFPVSVERFKVHLEIPVDPQLFRSQILAQGAPIEMAEGLEYAASNGAYTPYGPVKDLFLKLAAAMLEAMQ